MQKLETFDGYKRAEAHEKNLRPSDWRVKEVMTKGSIIFYGWSNLKSSKCNLLHTISNSLYRHLFIAGPGCCEACVLSWQC